MKEKREKGQYYTMGNPFQLTPFNEWSGNCDIGNKIVLEPFAGNGSIPKLLDSADISPQGWQLYDIAPQLESVVKMDTLSSFPTDYEICVTNPPWLAKNSATRRGLVLTEDCEYDDLYKYAVEQCLRNCKWVAAIIPESYIRSDAFFDRLSCFVSLLSETGTMFDDTEHPVGLALFTPNINDTVQIWRDNTLLGEYSTLKQHLPPKSQNKNIKFNDPDGKLGLIAIDNTESASIRFCSASEIPDDYVTYTCRSKTRISLQNEADIESYNDVLNKVRKNTHDVFLTAFKGIRKDGLYRRRLDWGLARSIIDSIDTTQTTLIF